MGLQRNFVGTISTMSSLLLALTGFGIAIYLFRRQQDPDRLRISFWLVGLCLLGVSGLTGFLVDGFNSYEGIVINVLVNVFNLCRVLAAAMFACGVGYDLYGPKFIQRALPFMLSFCFGVYLVILRFEFLSFLIAAIETMTMLAVFIFYSWLVSRFRFPGAGWMSLGSVLFILSALFQFNLNFRVDLVFSFGFFAIPNLFRILSLFALALGLRKLLLPYSEARVEDEITVARTDP